MKYFYDTSALLNLQERAFEKPFAISNVTFYELEEIKISAHKDDQIKQQARNVVRMLHEHPNLYSVHSAIVLSRQYDYPLNFNANDWDILAVAKTVKDHVEEIVFVTDDLLQRFAAEHTFELPVCSSQDLYESDESYVGVKVIETEDGPMNHFHDDLTCNSADCCLNEYVFLKGNGKTCFGYRWTGNEYALIYSRPVESKEFGTLKPKDLYQRAAIDSIMNNAVTALSGPAGSGKSLISLACAFDLIRRTKYDRVVMLVNPAKAKGSVATGFYPGTAEEKLLASFAGNMLRSKFGSDYEVDCLLDADKLRLISMSDIRGMEISANEILYIPECQNTTVELLKLCLSRVCEGAKVIFEGDYQTQVDMGMFTGARNGMKRAVEVLKGSPLFGYVELQAVWRSELAAYIDKM